MLRKLVKKAPIFLPFCKSAAVKSAAPGIMDNIIEVKELQIERKHFYVEFRENDRGKSFRVPAWMTLQRQFLKFWRITEARRASLEAIGAAIFLDLPVTRRSL